MFSTLSGPNSRSLGSLFLDAVPVSEVTMRGMHVLTLGWLGGSAWWANPLLFLALMILTALFARWILPYDALTQDYVNMLQPPGSAHWFGTDELGRDIYARTLYGARATLSIVILVSIIVVRQFLHFWRKMSWQLRNRSSKSRS